MNDNEKITFGKFTIIKDIQKTQPSILSNILETANPESIYKKSDSVYISTNNVVMSHAGVKLDVKGHIDGYSPNTTILNVYDEGNLHSFHKVSPCLLYTSDDAYE